VLLRHYPELGLTGLQNVDNAFEPWDPIERLTPERHPLRYVDRPGPVRRAFESVAERARDTASMAKEVARRFAGGIDALQTRARATKSGASPCDPLPPGSFGLPFFGESFEFIKGSGPFLEARYRKYGPIWKTHIAFHPTVCLGGAEGYPFFLNEDYFSRVDGAPPNVEWLFNRKSLSFADGDDHRKVQALLLAAFDDRALETYLPALDVLIGKSIARWEKLATFAWVPELSTFSFAAIRTTFMGAPPTAERDVYGGLFELLTNGVVRSVFSPELYAALAAREIFRRYVERVVARKRENPGPDVVSHLLSGSAEGRLTDEQLEIELVHFFLAGAPLESALAYHLLWLARRPEAREAARAEVLSVADRDALTLTDLRRLEYVLRACKESRRAARLVPNTFFAEVKKAFEFRGYHVPAGWKATGLIVPTEHDASVFERPESYDPSRFEGRDCPFYVAHGGADDPHHCIGERFTDLLMTLLTARLLRAYTWELVPGQDLTPRFGKVAPVPNGGLKVVFHRRRETLRRA